MHFRMGDVFRKWHNASLISFCAFMVLAVWSNTRRDKERTGSHSLTIAVAMLGRRLKALVLP